MAVCQTVVLTIACIHVAGLLAIGAVVRQTGGKLEPSADMAQMRATR
ncbi:hypothetical protein [Bradyrhizobium uaiense]